MQIILGFRIAYWLVYFQMLKISDEDLTSAKWALHTRLNSPTFLRAQVLGMLVYYQQISWKIILSM